MSFDAAPFFEDYFLANTPAYLLRKTLANPRLDEALAAFENGDLVQLIDGADKADATAAECVAAYVALIGLMKRNAVSVLNTMRLRTPAYLIWLPALIAEWDDIRTATTSVTVDLTPKIRISGSSFSAHD